MDHLQCSISRTFFVGSAPGFGCGWWYGWGGELWVLLSGWYFWLFYSNFWVNTLKWVLLVYIEYCGSLCGSKIPPTPTTHPPQTQWRIKKTWWRISFRFSFNILYQVFRIILSPKADWKDTDHIVSKAERMKKDNALHCIGATRNSSIWVAIVRTLDTRWTMLRSHVSEWWCQRKDYDI